MSKSGLFITFEGIDGTGKTSQASILHATLCDAKRRLSRLDHLDQAVADGQLLAKLPLLVKLPGGHVKGELVGSDLGPGIRDLLFRHPTTHNMPPGVADLLLLAETIYATEKVIRPALEQQRTIICDRYVDSQFAYSVVKRTPKWVNDLFSQHIPLQPDLTILLTGDPEKMLERARTREGEAGKQEGKTWATVEVMQRVQDAYLTRLPSLPRTKVIPVEDLSAQELSRRVLSAVISRIFTIKALKAEGKEGPAQQELFPAPNSM